MVRWLTVLCILTTLAGLVATGVIPLDGAGLARILFAAYAGLLGITVLFGLLLG